MREGAAVSVTQDHLLSTLPTQGPAHLFAEIAAESIAGMGLVGLLGLLIWIGGGVWWSFVAGMGAGALCGAGVGGLIAVHDRQNERREILRLQARQLHIQELALQRDLDGDGVIGEPVREPDLDYADFAYFLMGMWGEIGTTFHGGWEGKRLPSGRIMSQAMWERATLRVVQFMKAGHREGEHRTIKLDVGLGEALKRAGYAPVAGST